MSTLNWHRTRVACRTLRVFLEALELRTAEGRRPGVWESCQNLLVEGSRFIAFARFVQGVGAFEQLIGLPFLSLRRQRLYGVVALGATYRHYGLTGLEEYAEGP